MPENVQLDAEKVVAEYQRKLSEKDYECVQWKVAYEDLQAATVRAINDSQRKDRVIEALTVSLRKYEPEPPGEYVEDDDPGITSRVLKADEILPPPTPIRRGRPRKPKNVIKTPGMIDLHVTPDESPEDYQ